MNLTCFFLVLKCSYWEIQNHTAARAERPGTAWEEGARAARLPGCHPLGDLGPCLFCEPERSTYFQGSGEGLEINPCEQPRAGAWYLESALSCRPLLPRACLVGACLVGGHGRGCPPRPLTFHPLRSHRARSAGGALPSARVAEAGGHHPVRCELQERIQEPEAVCGFSNRLLSN